MAAVVCVAVRPGQRVLERIRENLQMQNWSLRPPLGAEVLLLQEMVDKYDL